MKLNVCWFCSALVNIFICGISGANIFLDPACIYANDVCPNEHISFWLYKNNTRQGPIKLLYPLSPDSQLFTPKRQLKILVHGFTGHRDASPNLEVRPVLLQTQKVYVVSVDYSALAPFPCYPWAVQNVRIVAKCLAQFMDNLVDGGFYSPEDLHIIGFSLGAQIAGLTANFARNRLKRITGLDPAGPGFNTFDLAQKLDASDADFVDVLHTDAFLYGILSPTGHVDFYPNLENLNQPGCSYWQDGRLRNCNHFRAPLYYAESIASEKGFWAYNCGDWLDFLLKRCSVYAHIPDTRMGYFVAENASGSYFLTTNALPPFAKGPLIDFELDVSSRNLNF